MGLFDRKDKEYLKRISLARSAGAFGDRASIFSFLFFTEGLSFEEAKEQAEGIASILGVPDKPTPPKEWYTKAIDGIKTVSAAAEENPKTAEIIGNVVLQAFAALSPIAASVFTAQTIQNNQIENKEDIDFNEPPKDL